MGDSIGVRPSLDLSGRRVGVPPSGCRCSSVCCDRALVVSAPLVHSLVPGASSGDARP